MKKTLIAVTTLMALTSVKAQDYLDDIMFHSFGWDEQNQSRITNEGGFYEFYNSRAGVLKANGFDMIWLPPASASTGGVGYFPTELFNFSQTSWGTEAQLKKMLTNLNSKGIYPIADVVANHRSSNTDWTSFKNPDWGCETIVINDEATAAYDNGTQGVGCRPSGTTDTGDGFGGSRDIDHTNLIVQNGYKEYLQKLKDLGFKGWRWDVAKGFAPQYFGMYIQSSQPYYSVGEYWDGNVENLKNWINGTYSSGANISGAFDFTLYYNLSGIIQNSPSNNYANLNWAGSMAGLSGQYGFAEKAVTFVDNHDTFSQPSAFLNNNIPVAYAYILTHPGIPSVFAPHYYGGTYSKDGTTRIYSSYANVINKLTSIRKATGIDAHSHITIDKAQVGVYGAYISKRYGEAPVLAMKIGPYDWSPSGSDWVLATSGNNYAVWTKTAVNTPPSINLTAPTGTYITGESKTISLSSTDDSGVAPVIRYTTDGTEPTASSPIYNGGITINSDTTIKAAAFDNEGLSSGVIERTFTFTTMTTKNIVIKFKPAGSNWALPYIHYWGVQPSGQIPDANWANPVAMTADTNNTGWYQYSFPNSASVNFLFRNGENNGVQGRTQTADITNITENKCYEWASSSPFVKEIDCSTLSVNDVTDNKMNFQVLENPAKGVLKLKYSNANNGVISIYDISGKLVKSFSLTASSNENEELNISQLKSGIYIIQLKSDGTNATEKIIVRQ